MARTRLSQLQGQPQPANPGAQQGWAGQPQSGPVPGWGGEPQAGPVPGSGGWQGSGGMLGDTLRGGDLGDDLAGLATGLAGRFIGQAIGRRVQRAMTERVVPAVTARGEAVIQQQIAIAQKYPELRMCQTDQVIFVEGGNRYLPWSAIGNDFSMEHADQIVAQLRG